MKNLRWGIIGTGAIAKAFARGLQHARHGRLQAVASRAPATARVFANEFGIARAYGSYDALLADSEVDAIYIATPHPQHPEWSIRGAETGKHVLCEKPAALNHGDAMAMVEAARRADVFWMEAFMYRCHPQTQRLVDLLRGGCIGEIRSIQAAFSFNASVGPGHRLASLELGGGGILDVGCYPVSLARLVAGVAWHSGFAEPLEVSASGHVGAESKVDEWAVANLKFPGDILAQVSAGTRLRHENVARIYGSKGWIHIPQPWQPAKLGGEWSFTVHREGVEVPETVRGEENRSLYAIEADYVAEHIANRQAVAPGMSWADTLGNISVLDQWRAQVGVCYPQERPESNPPPVTRRAPKARPGHAMKFGQVPGLAKPVSRLVMGVDNQRNYPHAAVMFDDFIERGGNAFDTAWIYDGGRCERLLGHWMRNRGVRDHVVVLCKGAHTPCCDPVSLSRQLMESLDRLQIPCADIYLLHRDNPEVPVGEFVDVLNRHVQEGRINAFGGSNWSIPRVEAANAYAAAHGRIGFTAMSNNLSLARMVAPPWDGCVSASDADSRRWLKQHQLAHFAWSSQARGFFTDRAGRDRLGDCELVRCWYSEDNFTRRDRAIELARIHGVDPLNIALAYVLAQPFPSFCLIGPRSLEETRTCLPGLEVELTPEQVRYLNLED